MTISTLGNVYELNLTYSDNITDVSVIHNAKLNLYFFFSVILFNDYI